MADLFDGIIEWLADQALLENDLGTTVSQLAMRLVDGGVPVSRISIGRSFLHPIIGAADVTWESATGQITTSTIPRDRITFEEFDGTPFGDMTFHRADKIFADLRDPEQVARYAIFRKLADQGVVGYAAFSREYGRKPEIYKELFTDFKGASLSFATGRFSGFSQSDLDGLERLITPICICTRVADERFLATELLETYLGRISGRHVLTGRSARGDQQTIECALFYSDMRNSLALAQSMSSEAYIDCVNQYFDCTARAVLEHGGEVLKFIGDGVLAIFPFDDTARPRANMCAAALSAAREAFVRAGHLNATHRSGEAPIEFGIALHVGQVIYGNVGTEKRLDFTATGPAVGLVSRCEALTRDLETRLIATRTFAEHCPEQGAPLGQHPIRGFQDPVGLVGYETAAG